LLSGDPPFGGCGGPEPLTTVRANILKGAFKFEPEDIWSNVSTQAKDFITRLLVTDPLQRLTAREAQKSKWLRQWANDELKRDKNMGKINPNVVNALVNFKEYSDMRKLLCEVLSFTLLPDQIIELRKEFEKMDTDGSGEISFMSLKKVLMQNAGEGMLGGLTEKEVEDIFNAMRVRKSEATIHWHEFIAAGLSQCKVDDRNLRLAFDRLDSDHKGFITFDDVLDLMGNDATEDSLKQMYADSLNQCQCKHSRISYDDFVLLMKGQTRDPKKKIPGGVQHSPVVSTRKPTMPMPLFNLDQCGMDIPMPTLEEKSEPSSSPREKPAKSMFIKDLDVSDHGPIMLDDFLDSNPPVPTLPPKRASTEGSTRMASSTSISTEDSIPTQISSNIVSAMRRSSQFSVSSNSSHASAKVRIEAPEPIKRSVLLRHRSKSMDLGEEDEGCEGETTVDEGLRIPLAANRELYRSHRRLRLSVIEASKRFEDKQILRTKHQLQERGLLDEEVQKMVESGAGLIMRRGHRRNKQLSNEIEEVRKILQKKQEEEQKQLEQVNRKVGRGKRSRKKVVSDMSNMMSSPLTKEEESLTSIFQQGDQTGFTPIQESVRELSIIDDISSSVNELHVSKSEGKLKDLVKVSE